MMRVATSVVIVALLTAAVTPARTKRQQEGSNSEDSSCIETFIDLEKSLIQQNSNINRLQNAFFPSNQRAPVAIDLLVHFSTSLHNTSHKLCNPSTARVDNRTADYKFRWSPPALLLSVQPEILRPLSLFVYQGIVSTAEVVIDPMCANVDNENQQMKGKVYKGSTNKKKPEELLTKLCIHLKSYARNVQKNRALTGNVQKNRALTGNVQKNRALTGYCLNYLQTDPHFLDSSTEDILELVFLSVAIIILWLTIAISVPAALYSVIPIKSGKKLTTELSSTAEQGSTNEQSSTAEQDSTAEQSLTSEQTANNDDWRTASTKVARVVKKLLVKTRESNNVYSILAVFTIAPVVDIIIIVLNAGFLVNCKFLWFYMYLCFAIMFLLLSTFEVVWISILAWHNRAELDTWKARILYAAAIFSLVVALQLLTFHGTFILVVFISFPIRTACFTLIYISGCFSIFCAVSTVIKVIHRCREKKVSGKKCHYALQITAAILFAICVLSLDALFYMTLVKARLKYFGISHFFGALVPTAITALVSFIGNMVIENNNKESNTGGR